MSEIVVLLAAGKSSRTTNMKQLHKVNGEYLINIQIKKLLSYGYKVAVVLGHDYQEIVDILDEVVVVIHNKNYNDGMFSSVKKAVQELDEDAFIFCHIDRPIADKDVFEKLLKSDADVAVTYLHQKKAPPIMIKSTMKESLLSSKHKRLDYWIEENEKLELLHVEDEKVHYNANSDEELRRYFG